MSYHRGQTRGTSGSLGFNGPRDWGPSPIVERPDMLQNRGARDEDGNLVPALPETAACYCTGLRHEHTPRVCPDPAVSREDAP